MKDCCQTSFKTYDSGKQRVNPTMVGKIFEITILKQLKSGWKLQNLDEILKLLTVKEQKILPDLQNIEKNIELLKNPQNIEIIENIALYHLCLILLCEKGSS